LCDLIQSKLYIKAQNSLSSFKNDINTLQQAVKKLKQEQAELQQKPIQQIFDACQVALVFTVFMGVVLLVDIYCHEWVFETADKIEPYDSILHFLFKLALILACKVCQFCAKIKLHSIAEYALIFSILLIISLMYAIKLIPKRYTVFTKSTLNQLEAYSYLLQ